MRTGSIGVWTVLVTLGIWHEVAAGCGAQMPPGTLPKGLPMVQAAGDSFRGLGSNGVFAEPVMPGEPTAQTPTLWENMRSVTVQELQEGRNSQPPDSAPHLCVAGINDLSAATLASIRNLEALLLTDCKLHSLETIGKCRTIKSLHLVFSSDPSLADPNDDYGWLVLLMDKQSASPTKLTGLEALTDLRELTLHDADKITSIEEIGTLQHLEFLHLAYCASLTDFEPLAKLPRLRVLHLESLSDIRDLRHTDLPQSLKSLQLSLMRDLSDLSAVGKLPHLRELTISICPALRDLESLGGQTKLEKISLNMTGVSPEAQQAFRKTHPNCQVIDAEAELQRRARSFQQRPNLEPGRTIRAPSAPRDGKDATRKHLEFPVLSGQSYEYSCEARAVVDVLLKPKCVLVVLDHNKKIIARESVYVTSSDWSRYRVMISAPKSAVRALFAPDPAVVVRNERLVHWLTGDAVTPHRLGMIPIESSKRKDEPSPMGSLRKKGFFPYGDD